MDGLEVLEEGGPRTATCCALPDDVFPREGGEREERHVRGLQPRGEAGELLPDSLEHVAVPADEVHLVDRDDEAPDPEERGDEGVTAGLRGHALTGVDEEDGEVAAGGGRRHVPGELLVARGVGDDEFPAWRREIAVGHVDRDSLLALGLQAVDQEREVEREAAHAEARRVGAGRLELVVVDAVGVVEEPPDQGALAVVDAPRRQEPQEAPLAVGLEKVAERGGRQK